MTDFLSDYFYSSTTR